MMKIVLKTMNFALKMMEFASNLHFERLGLALLEEILVAVPEQCDAAIA